MSWIRAIFSRRHLHSELHEEIEGHISERAAFLMSQGMEPEEAERQARQTFGNAALATERSVEIWQFHWLESLWSDLRFAFHQLRKSPGYTLTAVLTLAIGIGANAAIFTVIDDAMLRSLPIQKPAELVSIGYRSPKVSNFMAVQFWPVMTELKGHLHGVTDLAGWSGSMLTVPDEQNTLRSIGGNLVTGNALTMLGIRPYLGRLLTPSDECPVVRKADGLSCSTMGSGFRIFTAILPLSAGICASPGSRRLLSAFCRQTFMACSSANRKSCFFHSIFFPRLRLHHSRTHFSIRKTSASSRSRALRPQPHWLR